LASAISLSLGDVLNARPVEAGFDKIGAIDRSHLSVGGVVRRLIAQEAR
jgi:hypothetical protein